MGGARLRLRLYHRYFVAIMLLVTAAMAAVSSALILQYERSMAAARETSGRTLARALNNQFENRASGLALVTAEALVNPLALLNVEGTRDAIQAASAEPDVISAAVVDQAGLGFFGGPTPTARPYIAGSTPPSSLDLQGPQFQRSPGRINVSVPVRLGDQLLGIVTIGLTTNRIDSDIAALDFELTHLSDTAGRSRLIWLLVTAGTVLVGAGLSAVVMSRGLSRPIQALSAFTARIGLGDDRLQLAIDRSDGPCQFDGMRARRAIHHGRSRRQLGCLAPRDEGLGSKLAVGGSGDQVTAGGEGVGDGGVGREETLGRSR